ncbi:hypothetical protein [Saccharopolyspora phatthalungensis]|uniref:DUF2637 domain-containing protein n=1 Tax=Saccharopolyspora phatthalungensis TaxID=664693 RepID=A0A840PYW7_9PSEU|nr:hypothetical protein [Saccharopolyspora phatthalungensis]MBB5153174.1 hypothetical protein [Saccharopolyspora phatthalungensis]
MGLLRRKHRDSDPGKTRRVRRLGDKICEARQLRGLVRDPDLRAVEIERQGRRTLIGLWFFLSLGLVFTTTGVQKFLAGDATQADPLWWAAWTVEPMFAGLLIVILNFEAVILSYGREPDHQWWYRLKRVLLTSTLAMNVIPQAVPLLRWRWEEFNLGSAAVHAIIPVIVYGIAEVIPVIQAKRREITLLIYDTADQAPADQAPADEAPADEESPAAGQPPQAEEQPATTAAVAEPKPQVVKASRTAAMLPAPLIARVTDARSRVLAQGREFTAAEVRKAIPVPDGLAEQIAAEFATDNGHALT